MAEKGFLAWLENNNFARKHPEIWKYVKFMLVGIVTSLPDWGSYMVSLYALRALGVTSTGAALLVMERFVDPREGFPFAVVVYSYLISTTIGYICAYILNRKATFQANNSVALSGLMYAVMVVFTIIVNGIFLGPFVSGLIARIGLPMALSEGISKLIVMALPGVWTYPLCRFVIYRKKNTEQEETWEVFTRAAQSPEAALARGVVHVPADGMSPDAQRRLAQLTATLLAHPEPEVRMAMLQWRGQYPLTDDEQVLFTHLLTLMRSQIPDECGLAAQTIFALYTGNNAALVGRVIRELLSNRKALQITLEKFVINLRISRRRFLPTTRAILAVLAEDPLTLSWRIELIIRGLPWEEIAPELVKQADKLHANALVKAQLALEGAHTRPDAQLFDLEMALAHSENEGLRRLALAALIAQSRQSSGWSDECIARLQTYQQDPSPLVAEAAQFTFIS